MQPSPFVVVPAAVALVAVVTLGAERAQQAAEARPPQAALGRPSQAALIDAQTGDRLFAEGRYADARDAYRRAVGSDDAAVAVGAGSGLVLALLRTGEFQSAYEAASDLTRAHPSSPLAGASWGDALWSMGRFEESEAAYAAALEQDPDQPRARHGRARSLAAQGRLDDALADVQRAIRSAPRELEFHHTLGGIYERLHRFEDAAAALTSYAALLPNHERSEKAAWARAEIRFLRAFAGRQPFRIESVPTSGVWTMPVRISGDKVTVQGRVNGGSQEFILDTGAERTVLSVDVARRRGVVPVSAMRTAGIGGAGMRGLQVGRIGTLEIGGLKLRDVPCIIKNPPLTGLPRREPESFSPLAVGLSMRLDYQRRTLTLGRSLTPAAYTESLPLRMHRLALVGGMVNGSLPATFVVDTGGEVISISDATAGQIRTPATARRIPLRVYGTSGWDREAFLMPGVDLAFSSIKFSRIPVVVLNLRAPSALLGFQLGGIVGHRFLSKYTVTVDLERSVVGLE
jgi:predicted aspartyl protease/thioredoxin-like negative regulator of GroEL